VKFNPRPYQQFTTQKIIELPFVGPLLDMGLGKTVSTLTAINELIFDRLEVSKVLVIAPKRVAEDVWPEEVQKWDHLTHLKLSLVLGTEKQRKEALKVKADIYVINRENVAWLVAHYGNAWPFDMMVIDELSSFKNPSSQRFRALRKVRPLSSRVVALTGTPAPNGLLDLWSQVYLLDQGERLGKTFTSYRDTYFKPGKRNGFVVYEYNLKKQDDTQAIFDKISDICFSMKASDYLDLPKRIDNTRYVHLPKKTMDQYYEFERKQILALQDVQNITAVNAAALTNKLLQFANGAIYDADKNYHEIHEEKLEALMEDVEAANGEPVLVFYSYQHDRDRIMRHLKSFRPRLFKGPEDRKAWDRKEISVMLAHPASAGHGLNFQYGGHRMQWFGVPWSLEWYDQGIHRVDRQGQEREVINNRLIVKGTMDEDALSSLEMKTSVQDAMIRAVKARFEKYKN
jgi:SNF2 family DNA or RNA helicase